MLIETQRVATSFSVVSRGRPERGAGCAALDGLAGSALADRFCHWRGCSGRRYVFSVYRVESGRGDGRSILPRYSDAVVMAVRRDADGTRHILRMGETGSVPEISPVLNRIEAGRGFAADELHVHLLAGSAAERTAVLRDLAEAVGSTPAL